jgi:hypothetical protein
MELEKCLIRDATSSNPFIRFITKNHHLATEEVILTTKAMDFIEGLVE